MDINHARQIHAAVEALEWAKEARDAVNRLGGYAFTTIGSKKALSKETACAAIAAVENDALDTLRTLGFKV